MLSAALSFFTVAPAEFRITERTISHFERDFEVKISVLSQIDLDWLETNTEINEEG